MRYERDIVARIDRALVLARELVFPWVDGVALRDDAKMFGRVGRQLLLFKLQLEQLFGEDELGELAERIGQRVSRGNKQALKRVVGIAIEQADPGVAAMVDGFRRDNVRLVTSIPKKLFAELEQEIVDARANGLQVKQLQKRLETRFDVSKARASLIARDQTQKLNGQIARARMQNLGVREYIWTTAGDERTRDAHSELDGQRFSWESPPPVGHPGEDFQCRCTAFPVLPEFE